MTRAIFSKSVLRAALCGTFLSALAIAGCSQQGDESASEAKSDEAKKAHHEGMDHSKMEVTEASGVKPVVPDYVDNFRLVDHQGVGHELFYYQDAPAIVIMSHGNACPIVRGSVQEFNEIKSAYADKGVQFYMINSSLQDSREEVLAEAKEYGIDVPVLMDDHQIIGESLGIERTAEIFVIDPAQGFKVVYHGPINDRQTYERQKEQADNHYLVDVLDAVVAGEPVKTVAPALTPGCLINFPERKKKVQHANISYTHDVAPILMDKCVECHQPGGIGPWAMTDYDTIVGWSPMMREVLRTDRMPPWHADPHIGTFKDDRSLSPEQLKTLVHWIEADSPRGEGPDPLEEARLQAPDWPLGEPDLILTLPKQTVPATGVVDYTYPLVENPLTEDKWLKATTVKVGSRETVHHVLSGYISKVPEDGKGRTSLWEFSTGGYAVGAESNLQPEGSGTPFPAGGAVGFQMHYTPYGKEVVDETQIGFYFHEEVPELINHNSVIIDASITIPPNEARHQEVAYIEFPKDATLLFAFPHAHYRGHASNLRIRYPDGSEEMLLSLPRYDFNWQRAYEFEEPVKVPAGSKLIAEYIYDNSKGNPANPDPDKEILWGDQSYEEMLYTAFAYRWDGETTANQFPQYNAMLEAGRFFGAMDDDIDGVLRRDELKGALGQRIAKNYDRMDFDGNGTLSLQEFRGAMMRRGGQTGGQR